MNGHSDGYDYAPMPDDDYVWAITDIACPYCRHLIEWKFTELRCDNCELAWPNKQAVEKERAEPHDEMGTWRDEPTDEYMFNRAMRWGTK